MNYTENCRLPQWEETDRVLMGDFNDAFAALEEIGADHRRLRTMTGNLGRDLYRKEVQSRVRHGKDGETDGMWVNALETREAAGGEGHGWNGRYGVGFGESGMPTVKGIAAGAKEEDYLSTVPSYTYKSAHAAVSFTSDGYGTVEHIATWTWAHSGYSQKNFSFKITMTRLDTGETAGEAGPFTAVPGGHLQCLVNFPLEAGVSYRLEFNLPENHAFSGTGGFLLGSTHEPANRTPLMSLVPRAAEKTIETPLAAPPSKSAVGIVRWAGEGAVSLRAGDQPLTPVRTRESGNAEGQVCQETEFTTNSLPTGPFTLVLEMEPAGTMTVFDYGVIWQ